jgi:hypothetical protein
MVLTPKPLGFLPITIGMYDIILLKKKNKCRIFYNVALVFYKIFLGDEQQVLCGAAVASLHSKGEHELGFTEA